MKLLVNDESGDDNNMSPQENVVTDENDPKKYAAWQIEYYQKYFNVNTTERVTEIHIN